MGCEFKKKGDDDGDDIRKRNVSVECGIVKLKKKTTLLLLLNKLYLLLLLKDKCKERKKKHVETTKINYNSN